MRHVFRLLITDRFDSESLAALQANPRLDVRRSVSPKPSAEELRDVDGLIIRSRTRIDSSLLAQAPELKVIITATSGFDHIDLAATTGLVVMHTPEANAASAAELTWALLLACARRLNEAHRAVVAGDWRREALLGRELNGKTIGIVGLGRIGARVARIADAFGMKVLAHDPYLEKNSFALQRAERASFEELLKRSDVVSFHVPATTETQGMLTVDALASMSRAAILINASRGSVVSEKDLVRALEEKWLAACGLDVFENEPLSPNSPLLKFANVVVTPHLGATTGEAFAAASLEAAEKIALFAESGAVSDPLPPKEAWYRGV